MKTHISIILFVFISLNCFSVETDKNLLKEANQSYKNYQFKKSIQIYKKLINQTKNKDYKGYANYRIGYIYSMYLLNNDSAYIHLSQAYQYKSNYKNTLKNSTYNLIRHFERLGLSDSTLIYKNSYGINEKIILNHSALKVQRF